MAPVDTVAPEQPAAGAVIVDDPASGHLPATRLEDAATPLSTATASATAIPGTQAIPTAANIGATTTAPASTGSPRSRPKAKTAPPTDQDLLGTLLGIIKQEPAKPARPESMDALIAQIQANESRNAAANRAAFDSIDPATATSNHSGIQAQLRRCPPANTLKGIDCRRKICAKMAGKDPACPAN